MVSNDDITSLFSSASLVFFGTAIGMGSKFAERIIIANVLSQTEYGQIAVGLAVMMIGSFVGLGGLQQGIPRFISRFDNEEDIRGVWVSGALMSILLSFAASGVVFFNADFIVQRIFNGSTTIEIIQLFSVVIPAFTALRIGVSTIRGLENTKYRTISFDIVYPLSKILTLVVLLVMGFGVASAGIAYLVGTILGLCASYLLLSRLLNLRGQFRTQTLELVSFSSPLILATMTSLLLTRMDTIMIGVFRGANQVALYEAAFPIANSLVLVLSSFGFLYLPLASRLDSGDRYGQIDTIYSLSTKWIYAITFPLFTMIILFPERILTTVFGASYADAEVALIILSVGFFTNSMFGRSRETLSALGHSKIVMGINISAFILNIILNYILIQQVGIIGAAIASVSSFVFMNTITVLFLKNRYDITPFSRYSVKTFVLLPIIIIPVALIGLSGAPRSLLVFTVTGVGVVATTIGIMLLFNCLQPEDQILFDKFVDKF